MRYTYYELVSVWLLTINTFQFFWGGFYGTQIGKSLWSVQEAPPVSSEAEATNKVFQVLATLDACQRLRKKL